MSDEGDASDPLVGQVLDGRYHIEALIGAGGMGRVYRGVRAQLGKAVAIKVLTPEFRDSERDTMIARFTREAQATAAIRHAKVVEIFDFGQTRDCVYFVMELLEGHTLSDIVGQGKTIDAERLIWLAAQIADGLHAAHDLGIVHRDIKPANIFICKAADGRERVKILDFGLAKLNDGMKLTRFGVTFGTPSYMAPEQAAGETLDARTDVYALGCMMFEALAGHPPFEGENFMMTLGKHLREPPPRLSALEPKLILPDGLEDIISCALAKDPAERFSSMDAVSRALTSLDVPEPSAPAPVSPATRRGASVIADLRERIAILIAVLYLSLAHSTDGDLSPVELERLTVELEHWTSTARAVVDHALAEYASSEVSGRAAELTREVTDELREALSPETRRKVLAGMWRIAGADGRILEAEREFIAKTVARFQSPLRGEPVEDGASKTTEQTTQLPTVVDVDLDAPVRRAAAKTSAVPPAFEAPTAVELTVQIPALFETEVDAPTPRSPERTSIVAPAFEVDSGLLPRLQASLHELSSDLAALLEGGPRLGSSNAETRWLRAMRKVGNDDGDVEDILQAKDAALSLRTCAAMSLLLGREKGEPTVLLAFARELDLVGVEAITTALELHARPNIANALECGLDAASPEQRQLWLRSFVRLGIDPGPELIQTGLESAHARDLALTLRLLCVHEQRSEFRYLVAEHFFSDDLEIRQAALITGLVLETPGVELLLPRVARDPQCYELCLVHALFASDKQLDELVHWSRGPAAPEHAGFVLGYCGRRAGIAAAASLAEENPVALAGFRSSTGFTGEAELLAEWWSQNQARFEDGQRYMGGQRVDPAVMKSCLRHADAQLWQVQRLECLVRSRGAAILPALGLPSRLRDAVDALEADSLGWLGANE